MSQQPNFAELPAVSLPERDSLPDRAGVYFVLFDGHPIYIGATVSLVRRWKYRHHRMTQLEQQYPSAVIAWLDTDAALLSQVERKMIDHFKPLLNGTRVIGPKRFIANLPPYTQVKLAGTGMTGVQLMIVLIDKAHADLIEARQAIA